MAFANKIKIRSRQSIADYLILGGHVSILLAVFFAPISISLMHIFVLAAAAFSILSGMFFAKFKWVCAHPLTLPILLLFILVVAGLFWSMAPWPDRLSSLHKYAKLLYIPFLLPLCMDARWRERAISAFLCAMCITVVLSFLKAYVSLSFGEYPMPSWVFHSHIETSYFVAFATYILAHRAWKSSRHHWMYWILVGLFTYQEFFINDGRTGWSVYFLLLLLFFVQHVSPKKKGQKTSRHWFSFKGLALGVLLVLVLSSVVYSTSSVFRGHITDSFQAVENYFTMGQQASAEYRLGFVKLSLELIKEHPIFGLGTGAFQEAYHRAGGIPSWGPKLNNPHNEYLLILVQLGFVGLLALLFFFYRQWRSSFRLQQGNFVAQALLLSFMLACCYNAFLYTTVTGHFYIIFSSILFGAYPESLKTTGKKTTAHFPPLSEK